MNPNRKTAGKVTGVISNLVTVEVDGPVSQNEICYIQLGDARLMAEVIKVTGKKASVQVYRRVAEQPGHYGGSIPQTRRVHRAHRRE